MNSQGSPGGWNPTLMEQAADPGLLWCPDCLAYEDLVCPWLNAVRLAVITGNPVPPRPAEHHRKDT